jgi:hypothetical protein
MQLDLTQFKDAGVYLVFPDGTKLALTPGEIEERSAIALAAISPEAKASPEFQLCTICPMNGTGTTCHAIRPVLAFWEEIDRHASYTPVTAVYRDSASGSVTVEETTLQRALQYLSILGLMYYCEVGKKYWQYLYGVHPLMGTDDVVARVYLNMFWANRGSADKTRALINAFHDEICITTQCQMDRIRLFCSHDAFLNALVLTQLATEFLAERAEEIIARRIDAFERVAFGAGLI